MLCTCRAPDHIQTPQSWTPRLLISAFIQCLLARREERRERGREERERARKIMKIIERKKRKKTPTPTHRTTHTTQHTTQHPHAHTQHTISQPTMILRVSAQSERKMNAWICAPRTTDRDLQSVFPREKVNAWICACRTTDRDLETKKVNLKCTPPTTDRDPASVFFFN